MIIEIISFFFLLVSSQGVVSCRDSIMNERGERRESQLTFCKMWIQERILEIRSKLNLLKIYPKEVTLMVDTLMTGEAN